MNKKDKFVKFFKDSQLFDDAIIDESVETKDKETRSISEMLKEETGAFVVDKKENSFVRDLKNKFLATEEKEKEEEIKEPILDIVKPPLMRTKEITPSNITKDVQIIGNIICPGDLKVEGIVEGNIECYQRLSVSGEVRGNIKVSSLQVNGATITGNIECEHGSEIYDCAIINGNVAAESIHCGATINGNVVAQKKVSLSSSAILNGDCETKVLVIEEGAVLKGKINTIE